MFISYVTGVIRYVRVTGVSEQNTPLVHMFVKIST